MRSFLPVEPLTAAAFEPFGEVIETTGRSFHHINAGKVERYHDLAWVDVLENDGSPGISLMVAQPYALPLQVQQVERHPLSSQAFIPLNEQPFLVIVAPAAATVPPSTLRAFLTDGRQGVNYRRGIWHHVLLAIDAVGHFAVVDRIGQGANCERFDFAPDAQCWIDLDSAKARDEL